MMFQAPRDITHWRKGQVPRNAKTLDDNDAVTIAHLIFPDQLRVPGDDITVHLFRPATSVAAVEIRQGTIECSHTPLEVFRGGGVSILLGNSDGTFTIP